MSRSIETSVDDPHIPKGYTREELTGDDAAPYSVRMHGNAAALYLGAEEIPADAVVKLSAGELSALVAQYKQARRLHRVLRDDSGKIIGTVEETIP